MALLLPLLAEQLLGVSMGFADTLMVSSVGEAAISGVSLVDRLNLLILQVLMALSTGGAVIVSQYLGRNDTRSAAQSAAQLITALSISTVAAAALAAAMSRPLLLFVFGAIEKDVMRHAQTYFLVSAASYPFMGLYGAGAALFRAQGNSRVSMHASFVMNAINVAGNALLIFVFDMGVLGAALATLAGRVFAAVYVMMRLQQAENPLRISGLRALYPDGVLIGRIMRLGVPNGVERSAFQVGKLIVSHWVAGLGTAAIAANAVLNSLSEVVNIPGSAVSMAVIPVIGQCLGAGEKEQAKENLRRLFLLSSVGTALSNALMFVFVPYLAGWFGLSPQAHALAVQIMRTIDAASIVLWSASFTLPYALRAGGDARYIMTVTMTSMWVMRLGLCWLFVTQMGLGLQGVWYSMFADWALRGLLFSLRLRGGRWMNHRII